MPAAPVHSPLAAFPGRAAGTDAERRTALWLADELRRGGHEPRIDPFWCRPNSALAHAWHAALALAGSLVSVELPAAGLGLLLLALASIAIDAVFGVSLGRRLTRERASQNVVARPRPRRRDREPNRDGVADAPAARLLIAGGYDTPRVSTVAPRAAVAAAALWRRATGGRAPGRLAWLALVVAWVALVAALRLHGDHSSLRNVLQLVPSIALVLALAGLLDAAAAAPSSNGDDSAVALALALLRALDAAPPANLGVELALCGAQEAGAIGVRRHLRFHRRELRQGNTVVLGLASCAAGTPRWWVSDGPLIALRCPATLRRLLVEVAERRPELRAAPHRGRGQSPAYAALVRRLPATTVGTLAPRSVGHDRDSTANPQVAALELALEIVDALDAYLAAATPERRAPAGAVPA